MNVAMSADSSIIRTWLVHIYADRPGFISVCSDADRWIGRRFTTDEEGLAAAVDYVMELDRRHPQGIYAQTTTLRELPPPGRRGGEDLAHTLTHLWADGDFGTIGHKPSPDDLPAPPDRDAITKVVAESGLPEPSGWIDSGGGHNPVWMLLEGHVIQDEDDRARIKALTGTWQAILAAQAYQYGWSWDSEVGNLDRLMKLPGTVNRKEGLERPTGIGPGNGNLYHLAELAEFAERLGPAAHALVAQAAKEKQARRAARLGHAAPPPSAPRPRATGASGPFDVLAEVLTFGDVLTPAGFTYQGRHSDGREKWLRPAVGGDRPSSAYSLLCDDHVAVNWSERSDLPVGALPAGKKLTVPVLWAWFNYGGDTSAAASDIMRAAAGHPAGPAGALPLAVLDEVKRRCLRDDSPWPRSQAWHADDPPPPEPDVEDDEGWTCGPVRRMGRLPEDFWNARPVLQHIRQAAHSRARSADVVLGGAMARVASLLPPELKADTGVGAAASLNMLVSLLGPSGSGKSSAAWIPQHLVPAPPGLDYLDELPLGTGEGLAEAFMGEKDVDTGEVYASGPKKGQPKTERVRAQVRKNVLFYADEGESLTKQLFGRNGATIGESIRRAWNGGTIGQFNGQKVNTRVVNAGTYSLGIVVGFQPETALPLIEDVAAGTPQRFLWVSSTDPTIPEDFVEDPGPLDLALIKHGFGTHPKITFAGDILREIRREDWERATGAIKLPPLDSHKPLMRIKLASLLAILANRTHVTAEDWQLALVMWETSCELRDALIEYGARHQAEEAEKRTRAHVDREVRAHAAKAAADRDVERVAKRVAKRVHDSGGMTRGALNKDTASRDRRWLGAALDYAEARGWVAVEDEQVSPGDSKPS